MNNKKLILVIVTIFSMFTYSFIGSKGDLVENLNIPVAVGCDIKNTTDNTLTYEIPISSYIFDDEGIVMSETFNGADKSIGETRGNRQLGSNKKFLLGVERSFLMSEAYSKFGIENLLDILVNNPHVNEKPYMIVCDGSAEDILKVKVKGYANSGEFIDGLIKHAHEFNFFSEQYTIMDVLKKVHAEGYNLTLPYIKLNDNNIDLTGMAIFKKDKMIAKANVDESKLINLLREESVEGMFTIQESAEKYINYTAKSTRKVRCYKNGDKFKYIIDIKLNGSIDSNTLYKDLNSNLGVLQKFQSDMSAQIQNNCNNYISIAKSKYDVDILNLGVIGASKYGRGTGIDWNKVFSDADIEVKVKVNVANQGRGTHWIIIWE